MQRYICLSANWFMESPFAGPIASNIWVSIRPLQVILWFLVHRPHQILFLDFYLIIGFLSMRRMVHVAQNSVINDIHLHS